MESLEGLSDEKLACKAQAGHSSAFDLLVRRHRDRVLRHLSQRTRHEQDAEDLTQETFLKACKNLHRYDPGRPFSAWLFTIAARLAISHARTRRNAAGTWNLDLAPAAGQDPQAIIAQREAVGNLWSLAKRQLSEKQYRAIYLRCSREMAVKEIAKEMKITPIHVKVLLHRARKRLLKCEATKEHGLKPSGSDANGSA